MMEMVFRKIEYLIEGDRPQQQALDRAPWTAAKIRKKALKHCLFFVLSFIIGNTLLAYIIGIDALRAIVTDDPGRHLAGPRFHAPVHPLVLSHLCPVSRAGLHVHLPLRPVSIHPCWMRIRSS